MRKVTERPEAFDAGLARIAGTDRERIIKELENLLNDATLYQGMKGSTNPYGDGKAADRIVSALIRWAKGGKPLISPAETVCP